MEHSVERKEWAKELLNKIEKKYEGILIRTKQDFFPYTTSQGRFVAYKKDEDHDWWTNGFYPGILWLLYLQTGKEEYKEAADQYEDMLDVPLQEFVGLHHDVGFMWLLTSVASYQLTGRQSSRKRGLHAAGVLASRFNPKGRFLRAWNEKNTQGWAIIDSMMNIPLLYWAAREMEDPRYAQIAMEHADTVLAHFIRPDGSVNHIGSFDADTGEWIESFAGQGYQVGSSWTRGQAWAIYGFVLSYIHTKKESYLDAAKKVSHYFIASMQLHEDAVPPCDFRSPAVPVYKDTTAGAIAACGFLEIANQVPEEQSELYRAEAMKLLKGIEAHYCELDPETDHLLEDGTERYGDGVNMPIIYGDYYFIEALLKLRGNEVLFW